MEAGHECWPQGYKVVASTCRGRHSGLSEACLREAQAGGGRFWGGERWGCILRGFQCALDLGTFHRGPVRILGGDSCPKSLGCLVFCPSLPKRGIKLGSHRGERKREFVEPLCYTDGSPEEVAQRPPCPSRQSGLADAPLEVSETLLGIGRMVGRLRDGKGGGLDHGRRASPCGSTVHFAWQAEDVVKAGGSLCSPRWVGDPTVDGGMLLVPSWLVGRLGIENGSLSGRIVGKPSQAAPYASGQTGGPVGVRRSWCSQQRLGWQGVWRCGLRRLHPLSNTEPQTEGWKQLRGHPVQPFTLFRSPLPLDR